MLLAHTVKNAGEIAAPQGAVGLGVGTQVYLASPDAPSFIVKANISGVSHSETGIENSGVISAAQAQLEAAGGSLYDLAVNHSGVIRATGVQHLADGRVFITADGGNVSISGSVGARDADGAGGEIRIGGDFHGGNPQLANAARTFVAQSAVLDASASSAVGDGGSVVVWADDATAFLGALDAHAGEKGGHGGVAEVSGKHSLRFSGTADLSASAGDRGELLLDPDNLEIVTGSTPVPDALTAFPFAWFSGDDPGDQSLGADTLANLLHSTSVTLQATQTLTVNAPVVVAPGGAPSVDLSLSAPKLLINETVSLANVPGSHLDLSGVADPISTLTSTAGATLAADSIRISQLPTVALNGAVETDRLTYSWLTSQSATSLLATHPGNRIGHLSIVSDEADPQPVRFSSNVSVHSGESMGVTALIDAARSVTLSSTDDLTLEGADGLGYASSINAEEIRLASTGGVLINDAGANALTGPGRRVLYTSGTTGAFTLGGLSGYTQFDGVSFPQDPHGDVTLVLYNSDGAGPPLTLTITANDFVRLYGQANPTFTASFSGGTSDDLTVQPSFTIEGGSAVNVGTYTIVPSGAVSATHDVHYVNGTLRIDPAVLRYVANPAHRLYGDSNPDFDGSVTGFVNGDTLESATSGTLAFGSAAGATSNAGSYGIFGSGLTANHGNYVFEQAVPNSTALTVARAPLTVTIDDASRLYGSANPQFTATFSGFRNEDSLSAVSAYAFFTDATLSSSVGEYAITGAGASQNYALNFVPGTLRVTPAPLTLAGLNVSSVYGDSHPLGYQVIGLRNGDAPDVLSGVLMDTVFFDSTFAGVYSYGFGNAGTAQNYVVTDLRPGTLTITKRPVTGQVADASSIFGAVPQFFDAAFTAPVRSGPQFRVRGTVSAEVLNPGQFPIVPMVEPLGLSTLADIERNYSFDLRPGVLTVEAPPLSPVILTQGTLPTAEETQDKMTKLLDEIEKTQSKVQVVYNFSGANPLTPYDLARASEAFSPDLAALVPGLLAGDAAKNFSPEQIAFLEQLRDGKLSEDALGHRLESDADARAAIMPLLSQATLNAVKSGTPLTLSQQAFVARIANRVNEQRALLKEELQTQLAEFQKMKAEVGANNPFALTTLPDIAMSASQAALERAIGASVAGAGAVVIGGAGALALQLAPTIATFSAKTAEYSAALGAGGAVGLVGIALVMIEIGVQAAVMVAQEQQNKNAYDAMMSRAKTHVDANLGNLDLKNDALAQAEFATAVMMAMLETGVGSGK
jgi:hypothetical protein